MIVSQIPGSSQQPLMGQASACTGTYSLGETSQAQIRGSDRKVLESPPIRFPVQVQKISKSPDKKAEKCTLGEAAPEICTPTTASITTMLCTEIETADAPGPTSEAIGAEVGQHHPIGFWGFRITNFEVQSPVNAFPYLLSVY